MKIIARIKTLVLIRYRSKRLIGAALTVCGLAIANHTVADCVISFPADAIAYWNFDYNLSDFSGHGHGLTPSETWPTGANSASYVAGKSLQAGRLETSEKNFETHQHADFLDYSKINNETWTWVGWFRRDGEPTTPGLTAFMIQARQELPSAFPKQLKWTKSGNSGVLYGIGYSRDPDDGVVRPATAQINPMPYEIGQWYFIVFGMDGENVFLEVNRGGKHLQPVPDMGPGSSDDTGPTRIEIGGGGPNQEELSWCFQSFDEIGLYRRLLTEAELDALYANGRPGVVSPTHLSPGWDHTLAVKNDGTLWSWGGNSYGQLGRSLNETSPGAVTGLPANAKFTAVASGGWHSLAVRASDGSVWAWGYNYYGQLGDGTTVNRSTPVQVKHVGGSVPLTGVIAVSAGDYNSYALTRDGLVYAWGNGFGGALGNGTFTQSAYAVQVGEESGGQTAALTDIRAIAAGGAHCLALKSDGTVRAWGHNGNGQLGNGGVTSSEWARRVFVTVSPPVYLSGVATLAAGNRHSMALKCDDGAVWTWGCDSSGQLGDGIPATDRYLAGSIGLIGTRNISAGWDYSLASGEDGTGWAWGKNHVYQLGLNDATVRYFPVQIPPANLQIPPANPPLVDSLVAAKASHSFGIKPDWKLLGWGANFFGQVGDGTTSSSKTPPVQLGFGL